MSVKCLVFTRSRCIQCLLAILLVLFLFHGRNGGRVTYRVPYNYNRCIFVYSGANNFDP